MRTSVFLGALLLLAPLASAQDAKPVDVPGFWTPDELRRIDQGLDVLNVTRKDLGFQKRPIDDPFRLTVVNRILDEPLAIGEVAAEWDRVARGGDTSELLSHALEMLSPPQPPLAGRRIVANSDARELAARLPDRAREGFVAFVHQIAFEGEQVGLAFTPTEEVRASLLRKALLSQVEKPAVTPDAPDLDDARFLTLVQQPERRRTAESGQSLERRARDLIRDLQSGPQVPNTELRVPIRAKSSFGDVLLYGTGDDIHSPDDASAVLVIDLGGNDTYTRGASANLLENRPVQVVIDLAGDDLYIGGNDFSFGGALGGVAIQWDCAGNDTYIAGNVSCGAGILGVGVLVDEGGNDTYRIKDFGEGAGAFGIGLLLDKDGNDFFHADLFGQGFASTWGCGMLVEMKGNDVYDAGGAHVDTPLWRDRFQSLSQGFAIGNRPSASGGVGVLVDVSGNDRYSCDIYGQGASYWFSLGLLIDDDGHDTYACGQYGQGAGIHLSCGMLLDRHGQDNYYDANGVGMGGAHDWAVGFLVDRDGDDYYSGGGCAQGSGHTNSVGMLIDDAGDDGYSTVRGISQGSASFVRNTGGVGLLLDGAGKDRYSETTRNDAVAVRDTIGACIDEPTPPEAPHADPMNAAISKEDAAKKVEADGQIDGKWDVEKLWAICTAWEVGDNTVIMPIARDRFVELGAPALDRALAAMNANDTKITRAIEKTLAAFPRDAWLDRLLGKTKDADKLVRKNSVLMIANLKVAEALPRLTEMLTTDADTTGTVLAALAALKTAPPEVVALLKAPKESVGVQAAVCLGAAASAATRDADLGPLIAALGPDYAFPVRLAAEAQLRSLGSVACGALVSWNDAPSTMARRAALRVLGGTKDPRAAGMIALAFAYEEPMIRFSAILAGEELLASLPKGSADAFAAQLAKARAEETDPLVRRLVRDPPR